jgi:hypothetical protein
VIVGFAVVVLLAVPVAWADGIGSDPQDPGELKADCIEACADAHPELGDEYDDCVATCESPSGTGG